MFGDAQVEGDRWPKVPFDELVQESRIGLVRGSQDLDPSHPCPYLRMNAIGRDGDLRLEGALFAKATDDEWSIYSLRRGDFLFNTRNSRELVGKTALFRSDELFLFNNNLLRVRFKEFVDPEYVIAAFRTQFIQNELEVRKSGTTNVFAVYYKDLRTLPIPLPPLPPPANLRHPHPGHRVLQSHPPRRPGPAGRPVRLAAAAGVCGGV